MVDSTRRLKILAVSAAFPPAWVHGGTCYTAYGAASALREAGHDVLALTTDSDGGRRLSVPTNEVTDWRGVPVMYCRRYGYGLGQPFYSPQLRREVAKRAADVDIALIRSSWTYVGVAAAHACRKRATPYVMYPEGNFSPWALSHHRYRKVLLWNLLEKKVYQRAAAVVGLTRAEVEHIRSMGVTTEIRHIPSGVDPEDFTDFMDRPELERRFPALRSRRIILFVGRMHRIKGLDLLLPAFARLARKHGDWLLVLAGPDEGGYRKEIDDLIRREGIEDFVLFTGLVRGPLKAGLFRAADVLALTSYSEGLPVTVLEAMACGLPVVITPECHLPEVEEAEAGIITAPSVEAITASLRSLLLDDESRRQMGANGLRLVEERFTWSRVAQQTGALCEELTQ